MTTIVLDIDEAIVHTYTDEDKDSNLRIIDSMREPENLRLRRRFFTLNFTANYCEKYSEDSDNFFWGMKRPHTQEFLDFCFDKFDKVCIWSAGQRDYVHKISENLSRNTIRNFDHILTWEDCEGNEEDYCKPLEVLYKLDSSITPEKTFMIDDKEDNFRENESNGILIPEYKPDFDNLDLDDDNLLKFMGWWKNISRFDIGDFKYIAKDNIF